MRLRAALLALLLAGLAVPGFSAPGANPRPAIPTAAPVLSLAMADDGAMLATTDDPGSSAPTPGNAGPAVTTWYLFRPDGSTLASGHGDLPGCASRLQDLCQSPAPAGALAAAGGRFAVVANVASSVADSTKAQLLLGDATGIVVRRNLNNPAVAVAMDRTGSSVAVLERVSSLGSADTSIVEWFDIDQHFAVTAVMPAQGLSGPPVALAMSADAERLVAVADRVYLFTHGPGLPTPMGTGTPTAAAVAGAGAHGILWGTSSGEVAYAIDGSATARFGSSLGASAIRATAVSRDGKWGAAGNDGGLVRVFQLREAQDPAARLVGDVTLADGVRQLRWTPDGRYLAVRTATEVHLFHNGANLTKLWTHRPASAPTGFGLSANGDLAATAVGAGVVAFPAVHAIRADRVAETMLPGQGRHIPVTYRNDGNRPENATLTLWFPAGWYAALDRSNVSLAIDGSDTVDLHVILPALQSPGTFPLLINHTLASTGARGTTAVQVTVPERELVLFDAVGANSRGIRGGETVQFAAHLENRGNRAFRAHLLASVEPDGWAMTFAPREAFLQPGEHATINLTVTAPAQVREGDSARVRLTLAERPQEPLDFYATVGARFRLDLSVPPFADVRAGNTTTVEVTVQNVGNVLDSIELSPGNVPEGWAVVFTPGNETVRNLQPGDFGAVRATIVSPPDVEPGRRVTVPIRAASLGDPVQTAEKSVLVRVLAGDGRAVEPPADGEPDWLVLTAFGLAILAVGGFVAGYFFVRRR